MSKPDHLLVDIAATVESEQSNQMSLTVVVQGAVITGRLAPEVVWRERVAEVLADSARLGPFAAIFTSARAGTRSGKRDEPPTHLHFHVAPLPKGVPFEQQQYHALLAENGVLQLADAEMAAMAHEIGLAYAATA